MCIEALNGFYLYADYNSVKFWLLKRFPDGSISNNFKGILMSYPTIFGEDKNGELYVATFDRIYQIKACGNEQKGKLLLKAIIMHLTPLQVQLQSLIIQM